MRLSLSICLLLLALNLTLTFSALGQSQPSSSTLDISPSPVDAALSAALEKYFTLYAAKDLDALMSLWSTKSPDYASFKKELQQQFLAEDDRFDAPTISGVKADADNASLRATINRTAVNLKTGQKRKQHIARNFSFVRENGQWKIWRSVSAESDLAAALVKAGSEPERTKLLAAEKDSVTASLVQALNDQGLRFYN